ncbi:MAG TPA: YetF domain-containing protein [Bryobacteraceae bacterium]|nr:YetF domain-containing protein [Bryobacteraceae bacterium]
MRHMNVLFDGWNGIFRAIVSGALSYIALVVLLRVSGKRTLAKLNAFDLVVTVALGSMLATITLSRDVPVATGIAGLGILVAMQYVVAWASIRSGLARKSARSEPSLLVRRGQYLEQAMRAERVTEGEVLAAIRSSGRAAVEEMEAVVLETDGSISVIPSGAASSQKAVALSRLEGFHEG